MPENDHPRSGQGFPAITDPDNPPTGPDEYTRWWRIQQANRQRQTVLSGNIADINRVGAQLAVSGTDNKTITANSALSVPLPPGVDKDSTEVKTGPQAEADAGFWNRETEAQGLLSRPPEPVPAENFDPNPVDPSTTSPTVEEKPRASATKTTSTTTSPTAKEK